MVRQVKLLATKTDDLSSSPRPHVVKRKTTLESLTSTGALWHTGINTQDKGKGSVLRSRGGTSKCNKDPPCPLLCSVLTEEGWTQWAEGKHSLCGVDLNRDRHIGAPHDVSIDPHGSPNPASLSQVPEEVQGGAHSLETLEVQFDACRKGVRAGEPEVNLLGRNSW